eukprot:6175630-Pleurochrysis_carterae.AAC.1
MRRRALLCSSRAAWRVTCPLPSDGCSTAPQGVATKRSNRLVLDAQTPSDAAFPPTQRALPFKSVRADDTLMYGGGLNAGSGIRIKCLDHASLYCVASNM